MRVTRHRHAAAWLALLAALAVWLWLHRAPAGGGEISGVPIDAKFVFSEASQ